MKLVIFDVDGTLVDSQNFIVEAQTRAFTAHGMAPPSRDQMLSIVGLSLVQAFVELTGDAEKSVTLAQAYRDAWHVMRTDPNYADALYPGAREAVDALAQRDDVLLGVISFHDVAKAVLEEQSFENRMLKAYIRDWPAEG